MQHPENDFSPRLIDQHIDHPASLLPRGEAHLIRDLQAMYDQENRAAINRVWMRLTHQQRSQHALPWQTQSLESISAIKHREDVRPLHKEQKPRPANALVQRLNLLAALLVVVLLIAGLLLTFSLSRRSTTAGMLPGSAAGWGKVVHIQTMPDSGFNGLAWSPDSTRIAASNRVTMTDGVRIWDAATGQHLVTVPVHTFVTTLAWSPDSQQVAIETSQSIILVNGQTGALLRILPAPDQSPGVVFAGAVPLSSRFPASGGPGLRDLAWSPDGQQIAASFFGDSIARPSVLVWNLQTGALAHLWLKSTDDIWGAVRWSPGGRYIAAQTFHGPVVWGTVVWKVATGQVILQREIRSLPDVHVTLAWQPGTENLAQIGVVKQGSGYATAIVIFDGTTGKTLKTLVVPVSDVLTWSPDGQYLAYTTPVAGDDGNMAQILAASTWSVVFTYKDDHTIINELAWSPNGHFIATGETVVLHDGITGMVRVWGALYPRA
jgi:WD40 repeat protein